MKESKFNHEEEIKMSHQKRSLELLIAEGEQKSKTINKRIYFVYELLMESGEWFEKKKSSKGSPDEIYAPCLPRDPPPLGQLLDESGIKRGGGGNHGIFGFTDTCPVLLYVPGDTSQQAKENLDRYRNQIDDIIDSSHQHCPFKVRPVVVGKHKYSLP